MSRAFVTRLMAFVVGMFLLLSTAWPGHAAIELKYGVATAPNHYYSLGAEALAEEVKKATNGEVLIRVYTAGQLATGERELVEGLQFGTVDITLVSTGAVVGFDSDFQMFSLPYLFSSEEESMRAVDSGIGDGFKKRVEKQNMTIIAWSLGGTWIVTNSKRPIHKPEDMKGLKIRCMESPIIMATERSFGALGTPMSLGEAFTAMQQGTVDGQENASASTFANRYYEVQKYMALTNHMILPSPIMMSLRKFNAMSPELRAKFMQGVAEGTKRQREIASQQSAAAVDGMKAKGIEVTTPDLEPFKHASKVVYTEFMPKLSKEAQAWVQQIQSGKF